MVNDIREALAAYAHTAWSGWMNHLFEKCPVRLDSDDRTMSAHWAERWGRQMNTPYAELTEEEKESDRAEANKMLEIIQSFPTETSGEIEKELEGLAEWIERHDWGCLQVRDYLSTVREWVEAAEQKQEGWKSTQKIHGEKNLERRQEIARLTAALEEARWWSDAYAVASHKAASFRLALKEAQQIFEFTRRDWPWEDKTRANACVIGINKIDEALSGKGEGEACKLCGGLGWGDKRNEPGYDILHYDGGPSHAGGIYPIWRACHECNRDRKKPKPKRGKPPRCKKCGGEERLWDYTRGKWVECSACQPPPDPPHEPVCTHCDDTRRVETECGGSGFVEAWRETQLARTDAPGRKVRIPCPKGCKPEGRGDATEKARAILDAAKRGAKVTVVIPPDKKGGGG